MSTVLSNAPGCESTFDFLSTRIARHRCIAKDTWQLTVEAPELARKTVPGQFFMIRIAGRTDPLIGRALAMELSERNYRVVLAGRREQALQETQNMLKGEALVIPTDVRDPAGPCMTANTSDHHTIDV